MNGKQIEKVYVSEGVLAVSEQLFDQFVDDVEKLESQIKRHKEEKYRLMKQKHKYKQMLQEVLELAEHNEYEDTLNEIKYKVLEVLEG